MGLKENVLSLDRKVTGGALLHWYHALSLERTLANDIDHRFLVHYNKDKKNPISALCDRYGSDKGENRSDGHPYFWVSHTYADFYWRLFDHFRLQVKRVFECGLGTDNPGFTASMLESGKPGASLRVWRDYFPNCEVYGADIDAGVLFTEDRIKTYFVDQTSPETIAAMWAEIGVADFDLIIDDGLHEFHAGVCLFENSFDQLRPGGIYVIEDVTFADFRKYQHHFAGKDFLVDYVNMLRPTTGLNDNSLVVIRRP